MTMKRLFISSAALIFASCQVTPPRTSTATAVSGDSAISSCSYLTKDNKGNFVLSWIKQDSSNGTGTMYYAISTDSGQSFGKPEIIPPSKGVEPHGENMPKIIFKKNGEALAVFGVSAPSKGNDYTGRIYYSQSFDNGGTWGPATPLTRDTGSFDQRYFDVTLLPDGEAGITWLNNSEPEGSTLYYAATEGSSGFLHPKIIGEHTCQCCRTDLFADPKGFIHVAYRDIINDSLPAGQAGIRDMAYSVSADTGKTFSAPVRISPDNWAVNGCPHTGPTMAANQKGLHFAWFTMGGGGGVYYCHSSDNGKTFSPRETVSENPSAKHPQIISLPDGGLVIVWDENLKQGDHYYRRIGLQLRSAGGDKLKTAFITPDNGDAAFPMVRATGDHNVLVAYTARINDKEKVFYHRIDLSKP